MISVKTAQSILEDQDFKPGITRRPLPDAVGLILAENVYAQTDIPSFDQSAMDGYAFRFEDWQPGTILKVVGKLPAGHNGGLQLQPGEAARIFTGAPLPGGADTVVMQEQTEAQDNHFTILQTTLQQGDNKRTRGAEIRNGELALEKGSVIPAGAAGFLASTGCCEVAVYTMPSVAVVITGRIAAARTGTYVRSGV
jgi:molybdopterin molybdotransferase